MAQQNNFKDQLYLVLSGIFIASLVTCNLIANKFVTPQKFALDIEKIVVDEELNYIDAIIHYCEINNIEVESVTKLISKPLKERLKWDAIRLNFMKKTSRAKLPL